MCCHIVGINFNRVEKQMKVEVVNYTKGTIEIIETTKEQKPFIFKDKYYKPLSDKKSIYCQDGSEQGFSKKKEKIYL